MSETIVDARAGASGLPPLPEQYQAWVWQGGAEPGDLQQHSLAFRPLEPGEVWVHNAFIGLNPVDWKVLPGGLVNWSVGQIPGVDGAGVVVAVGEGVPVAWLGQRVAYHQSLARHGSFAHYTPVAARVLMRVPAALDLSVAATLPCPALTAWQALEKLPTRPGARLLVTGAGGAVGRFLVQLARRRGLEVTTLSHARHWDRLRKLGAQQCWTGPLRQDQELPGGGERVFDLIIDTVSADHAVRASELLRANGHLVCIQDRPAGWPWPPFGRALSLHEVALGALHAWGDAAAWEALTRTGESLLNDVAAGFLWAEDAVVQVFDELPVHLEALKHRQFSGKPIVRV
jgi:NADPH:quinone reductase